MSNYILHDGNIYNEDELMHYGIPGMKWGKRKTPEYEAYKKSKKEYRQANRKLRRSSYTAIGYKRLNKYNKELEKVNNKEMDVISKKAKYEASKSKDASKAEMKTYVKEMSKSGLPGSAADDKAKGRSSRLYKDLTRKKGKKYADTVLKKTQNRTIASIGASVAVTVGAVAIASMLDR